MGGGSPSEHQALFRLLPPHWDWEQEVCARDLQEQSLGFLQPSGKPHIFSNQLMFLVLNPRAGVPNMGLEPLTP